MKIYKKLLNIQSELKAPKGQRNTFGNYNYRSCEDIVEAVKPLLKREGLILNLSDEVVQVGDRYYVKATARVVDIEDGEKIETTALAREDETKKGMDLAKITGSVSSYARKYALNGMFAIDDTEDSDATNTHGKDEVKASTNATLSDKQVNRLIMIGKKAGITEAQIITAIKRDYNKTEISKLSRKEYDDICNRLEAKAKQVKGQ